MSRDSAREILTSKIRWKPLLIPLALIVGGGVLIDLLPIGGAAWLIVCLAGALLAGWMAGDRSAFLVVAVASIVVIIGTGLIDGEGDSSIGGRFPVLETLLLVSLPMSVAAWVGIRTKRRKTNRRP